MNFGIISGDIVKISDLKLSKNNNSYLYALIQPWEEKQNVFKILFTNQLATEFRDKYHVNDSVIIEAQLHPTKSGKEFYYCTLFANSIKKIESKALKLTPKKDEGENERRISNEELKRVFLEATKNENPVKDVKFENKNTELDSIKSDSEPDINEFYDFSKNLI